ncbi:hypothetical protein COP2_037608 [Malus domestica]
MLMFSWINNYFKPQFYPTSRISTPEQYAQVLIEQYSRQILVTIFYPRKVTLIGVGAICCKCSASFGTNGTACVDSINRAVQPFNQKLVSLVDQLNTKLTDAKFVYVNSFGMGTSGIPNKAAGFKVVNAPCCPVNEFGQCNPAQASFQNRKEYAFWDPFHPTEALNQITARRTYTELDDSDTYPMDISHLVKA